LSYFFTFYGSVAQLIVVQHVLSKKVPHLDVKCDDNRTCTQ